MRFTGAVKPGIVVGSLGRNSIACSVLGSMVSSEGAERGMQPSSSAEWVRRPSLRADFFAPKDTTFQRAQRKEQQVPVGCFAQQNRINC